MDQALVFDIETIADLTVENRDAIAALAKGRDMTAEHYGALCPPLARVVCIAWFDVAAQQLGAVCDGRLCTAAVPQSISVSNGRAAGQRVECALTRCDDEAALLRHFGHRVEQHLCTDAARLVTYNGRGFDLPVLVHRSVVHAVTEGRALLTRAALDRRFNPALHIDLMDVFTFAGAAGRWPLAAYAVGYGFQSPKQDMTGADVWAAVQAGQLVDVVRYCAGDVLATTHVYRRWHEPTGRTAS